MLKPDGNKPENTLELQNLECTDSCSWTPSCHETDDCNVPNTLSSYLDPRWSLSVYKEKKVMNVNVELVYKNNRNGSVENLIQVS